MMQSYTKSKPYLEAIILAALLLILPILIKAQSNYSIIPKPLILKYNPGEYMLGPQLNYWIESDSFRDATSLFFMKWKNQATSNLILSDKSKARLIVISDNTLPPSGYTLNITDKKIELRAKDNKGIFYATQTLQQMFPLEFYASDAKFASPLKLSAVWIEDAPKFPYRGMHLDVCRHFFSVETVKQYIDLLAYHKMNYFHWHLTEDQGWRIEIKKYPLLTQIGSKRKETLIGNYSALPHQYDGQEYGGFYTQEQIKEIVKYAQDRCITIVPEIEMPGHSLAALAAYPEFACSDGPFETATTWGVFEDVYCPYEKTFSFLEDVLTEVMDLFPGQFIHIGGDECPKESWKKSAFCQELMKSKGLKDEHELQSYFIKRIEYFINSKGKKIIGWDEILEGGLAPNATVMSWRGIQGGIEAAKSGHNVIMTPGSHCYFDHYQSMSLNEPNAIGGFTSVKKVYSYNPVPVELDAVQAQFILGAQGNVWTEYIADPKQLMYMALPRMSALSEVLWSKNTDLNYEEFVSRLPIMMARFDAMKVNYARHVFDPEIQVSTNQNNTWDITFIPSSKDQKIQYKLDNGEWLSYQSAFIIKNNVVLSYQGMGSIKGNVLTENFTQSLATGKSISLLSPPNERYPGDKGALTLVDGLLGGKRFNGTRWCGFKDTNLDATLDLGQVTNVSSIDIGTIQNLGAWVHWPTRLVVEISLDNKNYQKLIDKALSAEDKTVYANWEKSPARYVKVQVFSNPKIPQGDPGEGTPAWLFVDEIMVK